MTYAIITTAKFGTGCAWIALKAIQEHKHVESQIPDRSEQASEITSMKQDPVGCVDGVSKGDDRARDLGVLGLESLGILRRATGDQQRGDGPGRRDHRWQQREQQVVFPGWDPHRQPDTEDDQRQRTDGR
jgi:hypothetical protein